MDLFVTLVRLAGLHPPPDRVFDGTDLSQALFNGSEIDRPVYYYRGNELMALRYGPYKAHFWCWSNSWQEYRQGIDFCPGQEVEGMTSHLQLNYTDGPLLFHLGRDPGEKYKIRADSKEYAEIVPKLEEMRKAHLATLVPGKPQLDWCDPAVMHWAPPGCKALGKCLKKPPSRPYRCVWDH